MIRHTEVHHDTTSHDTMVRRYVNNTLDNSQFSMTARTPMEALGLARAIKVLNSNIEVLLFRDGVEYPLYSDGWPEVYARRA